MGLRSYYSKVVAGIKWLKTVYAGPLRQQILYDNIRLSNLDSREQMIKKSEIKYQADYWVRTKHHALAALILENFTADDLFCTLSFSDETLPVRREEVSRRFGYFRQKLRADGRAIRYVKNIEHRHGTGRWHTHCVLSGATKAEVAAAWIYGQCKISQLDPGRVVAYEIRPGQRRGGLAAYMCKEIPDKAGQRVFQRSVREAALKTPFVDRHEVGDNFVLRPPAGVKVIDQRPLVVNPFGSSELLEYLIIPGRG